MRKLTAVLTAATLLGAANLSMAANDQDASGSMDMEKSMEERTGRELTPEMKKQNEMTGDARGSTTGKKLIKSDAQKLEADEGGLDGVK